MTGKSGRRYFGAFSFVFIYCWYNVYWRCFEDGPIAESLASLAGPAKVLVTIGVIAGVIVALSIPWSRIIEQRKPLKLFLHLCAFVPYWLFPFSHNVVLVVLLGLLGGFCVGAIMVRSLYTMFFEVMDIHPVKVTIVGYLIIQTYVHINDIIPLVDVPPLYYLLSAATLLAGLVLSYFRRDEEEMERRRVLPENRLRISKTWQLLAMIVLLQICLSIYQTVLFPQTASKGAFGEVINIIPDVVMFLFLALFGKKFSIIGILTAFIALFACTVGTFFVFGEGGRIAIQLFMEPAYRLVDLLFIWTLITVFYTYGRSQTRLKVCLAVFFAVRFATLAILEALASAFPPVETTAFIALIPVFLATLLVPAAQKELKIMDAQRAYAEKHQGVDVPLPYEREDILIARDDLMRAFPQEIDLSADEQEALCYLIDGQDADVTAYFMGVTAHRIRELNGSILEKLGVKSNSELMIKLGTVQAGAAGRERQNELFEQCGLTAREREVVVHLLSGMPAKNIPKMMGVSLGTVNFHSRNLYRKLNIQSRAELSSLFTEPLLPSVAAQSSHLNGEQKDIIAD